MLHSVHFGFSSRSSRDFLKLLSVPTSVSISSPCKLRLRGRLPNDINLFVLQVFVSRVLGCMAFACDFLCLENDVIACGLGLL